MSIALPFPCPDDQSEMIWAEQHNECIKHVNHYVFILPRGYNNWPFEKIRICKMESMGGQLSGKGDDLRRPLLCSPSSLGDFPEQPVNF